VITLGQVSVADNKFLVDAKTADKATASIGIFIIDGQFDGESATGTHKIEMCGRTVSLQPQARPWRAGWVGAAGALPPTPTPFVAAAATDAPAPVPPATNPPAPTAALAPAATAPASGVYLAEYKPVTYSLGYGTYSVGTFTFSSEDPADNIRKGDPITFYGVEYPHAIFGHAPSRIVFDLGEASGFSELSATIGLVQHINCGDGVTFIVLGDDAEIFRSEVIHAWTAPTEIRVAIQGVRKLSLRADEGPLDDWACDWAIRGDPLLR
jgi:hypothetical protein